MNGYSSNFDLGEIPEYDFKILIRKQRDGNYRIFLVSPDFNVKNNINTVKDDIPFLGFQIEQGRICFGGIFIPVKYRQKGVSEMLMRILENISRQTSKDFGITKYINKPVLSKKLLGYGFTPLQNDIQAEICAFGEIPTIKIVKGNVSEILDNVDLSGRIHPPFYSVNQEQKGTGIIIALHTRFYPPKNNLILPSATPENIQLNFATIENILG